jgi:hypothetical protein
MLGRDWVSWFHFANGQNQAKEEASPKAENEEERWQRQCNERMAKAL